MQVKFKSPTVKSITIAGRTYKESEITPDLYRRFTSLSPSLADKFELIEEKASEETQTPNEDGTEKEKPVRKRGTGSVHTEG